MSDIRDFIVGTPFDGGAPSAPADRQQMTADMRTSSLRMFRKYLAALTYYRSGSLDPITGARLEPVPFQIDERDIHIGWPDNEDKMVFPSMVFLSTGQAEYNNVGMGPSIVEASADIWGPGTVLQKSSLYTEKIALEFWTNMRSEQRSILAGLEFALNPTQESRGIRLRIPEYYNNVAQFIFESRESFDEIDGAIGRRRARVYFTLSYTIFSLVKYTRLNTQISVAVDVCEPEDQTVFTFDELRAGHIPDWSNECCEDQRTGALLPVDVDLIDKSGC